MIDKKQEELEKMYALRAGLSLISQKYDEIEDIEKRENNHKSIVDIKKDELDCKIDSKKRVIDKMNPPKKKWLFLLILGVIACAVIVYLLIKAIVNDFKKDLISNIGDFFGIVIAIIIVLFFLAMFMYGIALIFMWIGDLKDYIEDKQDIQKKDIEIAGHEKSYEQFQEQFEMLRGKNLPIKKGITIASENIKYSLNKEFGGIIDIRDWENLDLIIYYYETGRADSIKEALQLVDNERRNNALIQAIGVATMEICRSIQSLGNVMIQGFASLSAQIEAQRVQITNAMSEIVTQQTLSNALLAKANVSSKEMVEQMKKLNTKIK